MYPSISNFRERSHLDDGYSSSRPPPARRALRAFVPLPQPQLTRPAARQSWPPFFFCLFILALSISLSLGMYPSSRSLGALCSAMLVSLAWLPAARAIKFDLVAEKYPTPSESGPSLCMVIGWKLTVYRSGDQGVSGTMRTLVSRSEGGKGRGR